VLDHDAFIELLAQRLRLSVPTSEDAIRYTFFAALLKSGLEPERFVPEFQHPEIAGAKVDAAILSENGEPYAALEFKYDKRNPSGTPQPLPMKAGAAFADLRRLARLPNSLERLFIHVMDDELSTYLKSSRNGLHTVYGLDVGARLNIVPEFFQSRSTTFHGRLGEWPESVGVRLISVRSLPERHVVFIFDVD
jgi:hypothetical protein